MSILIKGMEMPKNCWDCEIFGCSLRDRLKHIEDRNPDCPLVEIPTPHGRIVDYDRIFKDCTDLTSAECNPRWYPPIVILEAEE